MRYTTLGRTGLRVSVMGLGCGGPSRLGQRTGRTEEESVRVVQEALESGINVIDTAEGYNTERIVGRAIEGYDRETLVLSTKKSTGEPFQPKDLLDSLDSSLERLGTDYIDIYSLHAITPQKYHGLVYDALPVLQAERDEGRISFIGITEFFNRDTEHAMLQRALSEDIWDVVMVGFNILNQSARDRVLAKTLERDVGTLIMFAVRSAMSRPERLKEIVRQLIANGQLDPSEIDEDDPLGFLIHGGGAVSIPDAAYRFCRHEPGTHVVLSGTGSLKHLRENIVSFDSPPLPEADVERLKSLFRKVNSVTGQ